MTATSVLAPSAVATSWRATQRLVALVFVIVVLAAGAFMVGRASVPVRPRSPAIAPSSISAPSSSAATADLCHPGHLC
jgi:hypothetical protein